MKKFLSILLTTCLFVVSIVPVMAVENNATATYLMGDVDLDGRISVKDATLIQKFVASLENLTVSQLVIADVDISDNVNVKDATMIQKKIAGIIDEFPSRNEGDKEEESDITHPTKPVYPHTYEYLVKWVKDNGIYDGKNISYTIQESNSEKYTISYSPEYDDLFVDYYMNPTSSSEAYAMLRLDNYFYGFSFYGDSIFGYVNAPFYSESQSLTYSKCDCNTFTPDKMLPLAKSSVDLLLETLRYCLLINEIPVTLADLGFISYDSQDDYEYRDTCLSIGCNNTPNGFSSYCSEHACAESGCFSEKGYSYSSIYCSYHECNEVGCENRKKDNGYYCSEHECADPYCTSQKFSIYDYCIIHYD